MYNMPMYNSEFLGTAGERPGSGQMEVFWWLLFGGSSKAP